jgi:hypothetical protein
VHAWQVDVPAVGCTGVSSNGGASPGRSLGSFLIKSWLLFPLRASWTLAAKGENKHRRLGHARVRMAPGTGASAHLGGRLCVELLLLLCLVPKRHELEVLHGHHGGPGRFPGLGAKGLDPLLVLYASGGPVGKGGGVREKRPA